MKRIYGNKTLMISNLKIFCRLTLNGVCVQHLLGELRIYFELACICFNIVLL